MIARERSVVLRCNLRRLILWPMPNPATLPHRIQRLGSLARSSLPNREKVQQMVVRKPQLGEAISTVVSREKSFHLAVPGGGSLVSCLA